MTPDPGFRTDLYRGTAPFYDRYRTPYPDALFDDLRRRMPLSGHGRVVDLACGTGQIAFALARHAVEVIAVDQEGDSVAFGRAKAKAAGVSNITWVTGPAETVMLNGPVELVTVGNAFQRLNRPIVAQRMGSLLQPGGGLALLWADSPWAGDLPWQTALRELFAGWMARAGANDRVPAGWESAMKLDPHEEVLRRAGFEYVGKFDFTMEQTWTVETLTGFVYSTSFLNLHALGGQAPEFERDLVERLGPYGADGVFGQSAGYAYELARWGGVTFTAAGIFLVPLTPDGV